MGSDEKTRGQPEAPVLSYGLPHCRARRVDPAIIVIALCLPGTYCWGIFILEALRILDWAPAIREFVADHFYPSLLAAIITALISLWRYGKRSQRPRSTPVVFNLIINISGLSLVAIVLAIVLVFG